MTDGSKRIERLTDHTAFGLHAADVPGTLVVRIGTSDTMRVRVTGQERLVGLVLCEVRNGVLHVTGPELAANGRVKVVVDVPERTPVAIFDQRDGEYTIGDTRGPLALGLRKEAKVSAGCVGSTQISLGGTSTVKILEVIGGQLMVSSRGSAETRVEDGSVDLVDANAMVNSMFRFGGNTGVATLAASGDGEAFVQVVTGHWSRFVQGNGLAHIGGGALFLQ